MAEKIYEDKFSFENSFWLQVNKILNAIEQGFDGTIYIDGLVTIIPSKLQTEIIETLKSIDEETIKIDAELKKSWMVPVGHPSNKKFEWYNTPDRQAKLTSNIASGSHRKLHMIIDMAHEKGLIFNDSKKMPTSLVS